MGDPVGAIDERSPELSYEYKELDMKKRALVAMCVAMLGQSAGYAADAVTSLPNHVVATVNGVEIDECIFWPKLNTHSDLI